MPGRSPEGESDDELENVGAGAAVNISSQSLQPQ
jgi:hypothetical protein